ncbi:MAG TPA: gluconokinase [Nitrospiraceae bacterium]|nr:gluconokinase [Nitrospiraceae bacterium]
MIVIVMGVSGSGKSTIGVALAHALGWDFVDADWFHSQTNIDKMSRGIPLFEDDRTPWLEALRERIHLWLAQDRSVVLACSALRSSYRRLLMVDPTRMRVVYLKGSVDLIHGRLSSRPHHFMPPELLRSQMDILEEPSDAVTIDISLPPAVIIQHICHALVASAS